MKVKKPKRKDGLLQLQSYMNATGVYFGKWTNGLDEVARFRQDPNVFETINRCPKKSETIDEIKDDSAEKPIVDEKSSIPVGQTAAYTPEPTSPTCGPGTFEKNGICVMDNGSIKTPQESVSGGLENEFVILVIVLGAVAILAIILLAKRKKKSDSENN